MRILHVITQKPFATGSGVYLTGIVEAMGKDHEQHIICGLNQGDEIVLPNTNHPLTWDSVVFNSTELPFPVPGMSDVMPYQSTLYSGMSDDHAEKMLQVFLEKIERSIHSFAPDLIIFEHLYLLTAEAARWIRSQEDKVAKIPLMGICHGSELRQFGNTQRWHQKIREGIGLLDRVVSTHGEQAKQIHAVYQIPSGLIRVLGSGFDDTLFNLKEGQEEQPMPPNPLQLVYTGKLAKAKGVPELLNACDQVARHHSIHLTLIGGGANPRETAEIEALAAEKSYPIKLTGLLQQKDIVKIYRQSHIFILPSYYEGMPLVVPEALACGMSVAVTNLPGFSDWLKPFASRVNLIKRPDMGSMDEPSDEGRLEFTDSIAESILSLAKGLGKSAMPDLSNLTWQGLASRLLSSVDRLTNL